MSGYILYNLDDNFKSKILSIPGTNGWAWWGGSDGSYLAYLVDKEGDVIDDVSRNNNYSCRPYVTVSTDNLYVVSGTGTRQIHIY